MPSKSSKLLQKKKKATKPKLKVSKTISKSTSARSQTTIKKQGKAQRAGKLTFFNENDDQATPRKFLKKLNKEFEFTFDPCPLGGKAYMDGLKIEWGDCNYVNPPFSEISAWLSKGVEEMEKGKKSVFLIPARTHVAYWFNKVYPFAAEIRFIKRGLRFGDHKKSIPLPLALVIYDPARKPTFVVENSKYYMYAIAK